MRILCNAWAQYEWDARGARARRSAQTASRTSRWIHSPKLEEFARRPRGPARAPRREGPGVQPVGAAARVSPTTSSGRSSTRRGERAGSSTAAWTRERVRTRSNEFRSDETMRVLFSTDAGGLGLNLQDAASVVVNLEVPWNPAVLEQRIGRVSPHGTAQERAGPALRHARGDRGAGSPGRREQEGAVRQACSSTRSTASSSTRRVQASFVERVRSLLE